MRLAPLTALSEQQNAFHERLVARRGGIRGPFEILLRSPQLGAPLEELAARCSGDSALSPRLRELALLITARALDTQHSWNAHIGKAVAAGLDPVALARLSRGEDPAFTREDESSLHAFVIRLLSDHFVDEKTYTAAVDQFGEAALIDLVVSVGTFASLAMLLNAFEVDLPPGQDPPFPDVTGSAKRTP
ncbi:carboxymuconolactone decarboxylase family protein [Streptomyces sp. MBT62]|uniref:carboxymuconolactone decarboxylase family protein n=1 Tax=Streptomyces sp. MBT62 TaxID=2800410 RepID=UPI00190A8496|nr:carboxymuconolactone decarboxylase family protein [Streptomyces sp. MBT62]MBK3565218.1 carboxymuconolactone decarboxylase family protein [Streptomyces sp. MBT62]